MTTTPRIAIIGAGPAGCTLARILALADIPTTIYESDADLDARRSQGGDPGPPYLHRSRRHEGDPPLGRVHQVRPLRRSVHPLVRPAPQTVPRTRDRRKREQQRQYHFPEEPHRRTP
ncbi:hypothetical protein F5Y15DRAFT_368336 [Xylariaceae sp. FL0016]|nr:hypothetical protein F5Y15DRAFT_368336 [Xylariaceae sp. FL0016]